MSPYPQASPFDAEEVAPFLSSAPVAHLGTHNEDGTIHLVPLWFNYVDGEILFGTQTVSRKVRNIKRDANVTVMVDVTEPNLKGIMIYGQATLDYEDVIPKRTALFAKYMPKDQAEGFAKQLATQFEPVVIRVKPERLITYDYAKGFAGLAI